ncbi:hypothetical protein ABT160_03475 [Streptomyces sp. NPDC001941]|uniref:hypothetical protein n=1 Tax=Streptomyces sp. NPDC001941 TaxID=3154659 RepID=UPI003322EC00
MLTFDNVYHAPLDRLKATVDAWARMKGKLDVLAEDARTTMAAKARDEYWKGVNAEVTKPFVDKTAKEFADAAKAAAGVHAILSEGYAAFKKAQDDLKRLIAEAPGQGCVITAHGKVEAARPVAQGAAARHDPDFPLLQQKENEAVAAMQRRVDSVIEVCDDADTSVANALKANITADKHNFSAPAYRNLDAEEADRALGLARKGAALTHEELGVLNELLKDNATNKAFARAFYDGLGPEKSLAFFGQLATTPYEQGKPSEERLKDVSELQRALGLNLATATRGGDAWAERWGTELRGLGTERVPLARNDYGGGPYGYQLLGGILRYGNYDARFLRPIAEHVVQLHQKEPYLFASNRNSFGAVERPFNPGGTSGAGYDPVLSVLEALGHSPEAAKEFFSEPPTAYDREGKATGGAADLGKNGEDNPVAKYLDYFAAYDKDGQSGYKHFPDLLGQAPEDVEKAAQYLPDTLGHALEAATLGHAYDDPQPVLHKDADRAELMTSVIELYGGDAGLLKKHEGLADSLGNMTAGYIDDVNWALHDDAPGSIYAPRGAYDAHVRLRDDSAQNLLSALGQYPDAHATLSTAERVYTTSILENQVPEGGRINEAGARTAVNTGGVFQGILDQARSDQLQADKLSTFEDYEKAHEKRAGWLDFGIGAGVAAGAAFLPPVAAVGVAAVAIPLAQDVVTGGLEQALGQAAGDWSDKKLKEHEDEVGNEISEWRRKVFSSGRESAEAPMRNFIERHHARIGEDFERDLRSEAQTGYVTGTTLQSQRGHGPETG